MTNKEFVKKWVEALRSGKYTQGKNRLKDDRGCYCCLGVAVEVAKEMGCEAAKTQKMSRGHPDLEWWTDFMGANTYLLALRAPYKGRFEHLTNLNDTFNLSFMEIADCLEQGFLKEEL